MNAMADPTRLRVSVAGGIPPPVGPAVALALTQAAYDATVDSRRADHVWPHRPHSHDVGSDVVPSAV